MLGLVYGCTIVMGICCSMVVLVKSSVIKFRMLRDVSFPQFHSFFVVMRGGGRGGIIRLLLPHAFCCIRRIMFMRSQ